jgi:nucleoid-associated protein YgaU
VNQAGGQRGHGDTLEAGSERETADPDWGFTSGRTGMSRETKIGLFLIVVLASAFGFVVYKKLDKQNGIVANAGETTDDQTGSAEPEPGHHSHDGHSHAGHAQHDSFAEPGQATFHGGNDRTQVRRKPSEGGFDVPQQFEPSGNETAGRNAEPEPNPFATAEITPGPRNNRRLPARTAQRQPLPEEGQEAFDPFAADPAASARPAVHQQPEPEFGLEDESQQAFESRKAPFQPTQQAAAPQQTGQQQAPDDFGAAEPFPTDAATAQGVGPNQNFSGAKSFDVEQNAVSQKGQFQPPIQRQPGTESGGDNPFAQSQNADGFEAPRQAAQNQNQSFEPRSDDFRPVPSRHAQAGSTTVVGKTGGASRDPSSFADPRQQPFPEQAVPINPRAGGQVTSRPVTQPDPFGQKPTFREDPATADVNVRIYVVEPGDNYWEISKKQYGTARYFSALARYNQSRISDPNKLRVGMKVLIPQPQALVARYPDLFPGSLAHSGGGTGVTQVSGELTPGFFFDDSGRPMYRVGGADTLADIAKAHLGRTARWIQIHEMNRDRLQNPHDLQVGTVLRLPGDASQVRLVQHPAVIR